MPAVASWPATYLPLGDRHFMTRRIDPLRHALAVIVAHIAVATAPLAAQTMPTTRLSWIDTETDLSTVAAINGVRVLSGGRVLVNDRAMRRVLMLDSRLRPIKAVLDATPASGALYGFTGGRLLAMPGDSTLFVDGASRTFTVLDPEGRVVRRDRAPAAVNLNEFFFGAPLIDGRGRLLYRGGGFSQRELFELSSRRRWRAGAR